MKTFLLSILFLHCICWATVTQDKCTSWYDSKSYPLHNGTHYYVWHCSVEDNGDINIKDCLAWKFNSSESEENNTAILNEVLFTANCNQQNYTYQMTETKSTNSTCHEQMWTSFKMTSRNRTIIQLDGCWDKLRSTHKSIKISSDECNCESRWNGKTWTEVCDRCEQWLSLDSVSGSTRSSFLSIWAVFLFLSCFQYVLLK